MWQVVQHHLPPSLMSVFGLKNAPSVKTLSLKESIHVIRKPDCLFAGVTELGYEHPTISVFYILSFLFTRIGNTSMILTTIVELSIHCAVKRL